jgi:uncharacterized protein YbjT (DUF2867 family)
MRVLVTGGTGMLGRQVVARLRDQRVDEVRALSRAAAPGRVQGDLETGDGLAEAVRDVDAIVHCATAGDMLHPTRDLAQTRNLLAAADGARPHVVYISIVGVDQIPFGLYRAKHACERMVASSGLPWTVLRATQFHELILMLAMITTRAPVGVTLRGWRSQPVDVAEVADRLAELALGTPAGRVADLGGPRVESIAELTRAYLAATGRQRPVLELPVPGRASAGFRAGLNLLGRTGERRGGTFEQFLRDHLAPDGTIAAPYDLSGRPH